MIAFSRVPVQLRLAALMKKKGVKSAYQLAQLVGDRVSAPTIYRLVRSGGRVENIKADTLEALADVFGCEIGVMFEQRRKR